MNIFAIVIAVVLSLFLVAGISISLFIISNAFFDQKDFLELDNHFFYYRFFFFSIIILITYAFVSIVIFYRIAVERRIKIVIASLLSTAIIYVLHHIGGGKINLEEMKDLALIFLIFIISLIAPIVYGEVYRRINI